MSSPKATQLEQLIREIIESQKPGSSSIKKNKLDELLEEISIYHNELYNFFDVNLDLLCIADTSGNLLKWNKEWEKYKSKTSLLLIMP